ncbi:Glucosamine--fructose-6-phosphate aminotransferase (isomerizing) [Bacillus mojavensis]|uniref:Glucosamine--fructose-6-phosphate aminotransferase (Isomerizing) n=1 Tax=Bacillus mojavensis TaxID=72360 RepID=A0ABX6LSN5_BACMO|nr:Glucosamine--fructose-6-phosphate aminotransferase (isomerizing) [Bacillus mojavensis]
MSKAKEISYGFAGGELKHSTIALIEQGTPVFESKWFVSRFISSSQEYLYVNLKVRRLSENMLSVCYQTREGLFYEIKLGKMRQMSKRNLSKVNQKFIFIPYPFSIT